MHVREKILNVSSTAQWDTRTIKTFEAFYASFLISHLKGLKTNIFLFSDLII